ncbi:MAG TPA: ABC transporter ATP-binding protein [Lacipirellulaceae bacterium]|jgi:ABC-2 type transport system ATP-binding protein
MSAPSAINISHLAHRYGEHVAIHDLSLTVSVGEIFVLLGPNGSGKTTLFRVLSTLIPPQQGEVQILGNDLRRQAEAIRAQLGVVFQAPSVDKKLTVAENITHYGRLYGLSGSALRTRIAEMLGRLRLADRRHDKVETLSGGLRRRVELAQAMLHRPQLLLLDEPSTGLDPGARSDVWQYLEQVRREEGVTVVLTTHLLEEAARADRIAIMHLGELAALDTPAALQASVGGDAITIRTADPDRLAEDVARQFNCAPMIIDGSVRLEQPNGHQWVPRLVEAFPDRIEAITLGKPTLEDVFIHKTGHQFWTETPSD